LHRPPDEPLLLRRHAERKDRRAVVIADLAEGHDHTVSLDGVSLPLAG
jgi:hypothetical protein